MDKIGVMINYSINKKKISFHFDHVKLNMLQQIETIQKSIHKKLYDYYDTSGNGFMPYILSKEEIEIIHHFLRESPYTLENIIDNITDIIKEDKINIHNIPQIIHIISNIYHSEALRLEYKNINLLWIIKITLECILEVNINQFSDTERNVIEKIVDSSFDLLKLNIRKVNETDNKCYGLCMTM